MLEIKLEPEFVLRTGNFLVANTLLTSVATSIFLIAVAFWWRKSLAGVFGHGLGQRCAEVVLYPLWNLCNQVLESEALVRKIFPLIATFFLFIITANWLEILPGFLNAFYLEPEHGHKLALFRSPSTDLNTTLALGLISVAFTKYMVLKILGVKKFLTKIIDIRKPIQAFTGILELISEFSKIFSFAFRLFGNMFAGGVLLLVTGFLVPYIVPLPFMILEIFVGMIQALVFTLLTLMFIKAAISSYD